MHHRIADELFRSCRRWRPALGHALVTMALAAAGSNACRRIEPAPRHAGPNAAPRAPRTSSAIPLPPPPNEDTRSLDALLWPDVVSDTLPAGTTIRVASIPTWPSIHLRVVIPAGFGDDAARPGLARLTAWSLLESAMGPAAAPKRRYGLDRIANVSAHVTADFTEIRLDTTTDHVVEVVERLQTLLSKPTFRPRPHRLAQARAPGWLEAQRFGDAVERALQDLPPAPDERAWSRIRPWQCRQFFRAHYDPNATKVTWVGDITKVQARSFTEQMVSGWQPPRPRDKPRETAPKEPTEPTPPSSGRVRVAVVAKGPAWDHEDWPALWLVAQSVTRDCPALPWAGTVPSFRVCETVPAAEATSAAQRLRAKLSAIVVEGLDPERLERVKRRLVHAEAARLRSPSVLADTLAHWTQAEAGQVGARVQNVDDIAKAARRHLGPDSLRVVVVGVR